MEELKERLDIDEYSISQTTLEQIFNGFARVSDTETKERKFSSKEMNILQEFSVEDN